MQKWKYKIENIQKDVQDHLNSLGAQGWELVAVVDGAYYFKQENNELDKPNLSKPYPAREPVKGHPVG